MFKNNRFVLLLAVLGLLAGVTLLAPLTVAAFGQAQASDPTTVVQAYYDAYNARDFDAAMEYITDETVFINPVGTFKGTAEIRAHIESIAQEGLTFELSDLKDDNGRVIYAYKVLINGEGVETGTDGLSIVKDGKLAFDGTVGTETQLPTTGTPFSLTPLWLAVAALLLVSLGVVVLVRRTHRA